MISTQALGLTQFDFESGAVYKKIFWEMTFLEIKIKIMVFIIPVGTHLGRAGLVEFCRCGTH